MERRVSQQDHPRSPSGSGEQETYFNKPKKLSSHIYENKKESPKEPVLIPCHNRQHYAAREATCHKCGKEGHFKSVCRSSAPVRGVQTDKSSTDHDIFLGVVTSEDSISHNSWSVILQLNSVPVKFHIDTGAEVTIISESIYKKVSSLSLCEPDQTLHGPSNQTLPASQGRIFCSVPIWYYYYRTKLSRCCRAVMTTTRTSSN